MAVNKMPPAELYLKVGDMELKGDIVDMARIDADNILEEMMEQPATYTHLATMHAKAVREVAHLKRDRDRLYSSIYAEIKQKAVDEGAKFTETGAEKEVNKVPAFQQILEDITEAEYRVGQLQAICTAFQMRTSLIGHVAAHVRASEGSLPERVAEKVHEEIQAKRRRAAGS